MIDIEYSPPIMTPVPAVIRYAKKHNVKLLADEFKIERDDKSNYRYKQYKYVYPCFDSKNTCTILYKNRWDIRFATPEEEKEIYIECR